MKAGVQRGVPAGCRFGVIVCVSVFALAGCAGVKETVRGIAGNSTKVLYDTRAQAAAKEFPCGREECAAKVAEILMDMKAYVYAREGDLTAVFVSEEDTTPVGVFLVSADEGKTRIEVSSPSSFARDTVAQKLFTGLDMKLKVKKIDVQLDAIEGKR